MLQRDYIQRLIREFMAALQRLLEKKEVGERQEEVRRLFTQYMGDYAFFHTASLDDIMRWFEKYNEEERLDRIGMLAELYYAEADTMSEPMRSDVLDKAFLLFDFIDRHSRTYSPERLKKMREIENIKKTQN
jgi:hypothetical protein